MPPRSCPPGTCSRAAYRESPRAACCGRNGRARRAPRSRSVRSILDTASEPASTLGQNQIVGSASCLIASTVSLMWSEVASISVVTGCCITTSSLATDRASARRRHNGRTDRSSVARILEHLAGEVDRRAAGVEHAFGVLAHADHVLPRALGRDEMQIGELGDGMAHLLVDRAGDLAALDMGEREVAIGGGGGGRQRLVAVRDGDDDVGPELLEHGRKLAHADAGRLWPRQPACRPPTGYGRARVMAKPSCSITEATLP